MRFRAAAVQMLAGDDKAANLREAERWVRRAAAEGARLVALPEVFNWRGERRREREAAEPIPGPTSSAMGSLARELKIFLLAGSLLEAIPGSDKAYNSSLLFGPSGELLARYRKIHLFDVDLARGVSVRESDTRAFGETPVVARTESGVLGLTICYDLRFPELYRRLAADGAEVICVPSAFTAYTGRAHWEVLLRARAIENQVYVIAPDQFGKSPKSFETHGHSMIVDPWGRVLAELPDGPGAVVAEIDLSLLAQIRAELPALAHRRIL
ncbi:MAG TPA: carbon-nitrogen hydrolase family protein [candidate division Zixibacteria bacterium]|nr:carbon-nitrogen hydrolase family protein [candidate division Zixibacteria bacterium]